MAAATVCASELNVVYFHGGLDSSNLYLPEIPYVLRLLMFGASLETLPADDHRGLSALDGPKLSSVARHPAAYRRSCRE